LVNDPTPIRKMSEDREIDATDARQVTSHAVLQSQRICSLGSACSSDLSIRCYRNRNKGSVRSHGS
jgi:hypothetical protein